MTNEQKILDILAIMQSDMQGMRNDIQGVKNDMQSMEARLDQKIENTRTDIMAYIENEVNPKLELLAGGHRTILDTMVPVSRVDELEEDVKLLKMAFRQMSAEIQDLKKAQ